MGLVKDWIDDHRGYTLRAKIEYFFSPKVWFRLAKYRKQRANRGWSDRDTWNGGEYIAEVTIGILNYLQSEKGHVDWDEYFKWNYTDNYGFKSLNEVADELQLYLDWYIIQYEEPYRSLDIETRIAIDLQVYSQAKDAMHFVAENIGGLWD